MVFADTSQTAKNCICKILPAKILLLAPKNASPFAHYFEVKVEREHCYHYFSSGDKLYLNISPCPQ